ncbi:MAG TPA: hypothetical protein V6D19_09965 [Stenomitos sp.]
MIRSQLLLIGTLTVLGLTSCGSPQSSTPEASAPASEASSPAMQASSSRAAASGFTALKDITTKTEASVKAQKFNDAKTEFDKFEESWKTVEDGVKSKSSQTYNSIEENLDTVIAELKNSKPDQTKLLTALQALSNNMASAAKL